MTKTFAIFSKASGAYMYSVDADDREAAIDAFAAFIGGEPEAFDRSDCLVHTVTADELAAIEDWWEHGGRGEFPLAGRYPE